LGGRPHAAARAVGHRQDHRVDDYQWELYDVSNDFSQAHDLAAKEPKKHREL
jgi:arylsulfatase